MNSPEAIYQISVKANLLIEVHIEEIIPLC